MALAKHADVPSHSPEHDKGPIEVVEQQTACEKGLSNPLRAVLIAAAISAPFWAIVLYMFYR